MLIFDNFPSLLHAGAFAKKVRDDYDIQAVVCQTAEEVYNLDLVPFEVRPPAVAVERLYSKFGVKAEEEVVALVKRFKGLFAGT